MLPQSGLPKSLPCALCTSRRSRALLYAFYLSCGYVCQSPLLSLGYCLRADLPLAMDPCVIQTCILGLVGASEILPEQARRAICQSGRLGHWQLHTGCRPRQLPQHHTCQARVEDTRSLPIFDRRCCTTCCLGGAILDGGGR